MQDYELSVLEQYPINVKSTRKTRGAFFCDTEQGFFLLREAGMSERQLLVMRHLCLYLEQEGKLRTDLPVANCEGSYISVSQEGKKYILKQWLKGRECDIRKSRDLMEGTVNLAHLHRFMQQVPPCPGEDVPQYLPESDRLKKEYESHSRELNKIRRFIRKKTPKGEFELEFLKCFDSMFEWAGAALEILEKTDLEDLYHGCIQNHTMIHGDYNYHNILMLQNGCGTTNFDRCRVDVQTEDLYYFLRKAMEKHGWSLKCGDHMLDAYSAVRPMGKKEMDYLKIRLIYPEKFWKLADSYYRSSKAWTPARNAERLKAVVMQTEEKSRFLEQLFSFHI